MPVMLPLLLLTACRDNPTPPATPAPRAWVEFGAVEGTARSLTRMDGALVVATDAGLQTSADGVA